MCLCFNLFLLGAQIKLTAKPAISFSFFFKLLFYKMNHINRKLASHLLRLTGSSKGLKSAVAVIPQ